MKVINNSRKEISDTVKDAILARNSERDFDMFALIFTISYKTNEAGRKTLVPVYRHAILSNPTQIVDGKESEDSNIYLSTAPGEYKIANEDEIYRRIRGNFPISADAQIIDVEKFLRTHKHSELPKGEQVIELYFGDNAFDYMSKTKEEICPLGRLEAYK